MDTTTTLTTTNTSRLERPFEGRVLAGVAAGIAERAGLSVGLVRVGFVVASLFGGFGILLYLAGWAAMPDEGVAESTADRWLAHLRDPNRRVAAVLIGVGVAVAATWLAPVAAVAAAALIVGAAMLAVERPSTGIGDDVTTR
ncbi:MAG TPA: PspC domain-containing protein [Acidimicrobiia bacterium]|jgi:phage shock protein PspC (stress-responsive transcriptional regulator)